METGQQPFREGEVLIWEVSESGNRFLPGQRTRRTVTLLELNGDTATVGWGLADGEPVRYSARLADLYRAEPAAPDPTYFPGGKPFTVPKSPQRLTVEAL